MKVLKVRMEEIVELKVRIGDKKAGTGDVLIFFNIEHSPTRKSPPSCDPSIVEVSVTAYIVSTQMHKFYKFLLQLFLSKFKWHMSALSITPLGFHYPVPPFHSPNSIGEIVKCGVKELKGMKVLTTLEFCARMFVVDMFITDVLSL